MHTDDFLYKELTERLLGIAFKIHNKLGFGFLEKIYENALTYEFKKEGISFEKQKTLQVWYEDIIIGDYVADVVVEDKIILEIKAVKELNSTFEAQLLNYLKATGLKIGYLLNFGKSRVEYKRIILSVFICVHLWLNFIS